MFLHSRLYIKYGSTSCAVTIQFWYLSLWSFNFAFKDAGFFLSFFFLFLKSYLSKLSNNASKIEKQSASIDYVN